MTTILNSKLDVLKTPIDHVNSLAYNRSLSSVEETRAALYIQAELNEENIESRMEYFSFTGAKRLFMRLTYIITFCYLVVFRLFLIIIAYFSIKYLFQKFRNYSLVGREKSKNIVAKIRAKKKNQNRAVVILSAHYDTFSSNLPYGLQKIFFFLFKIIILPYVLFAFIIANIFIFKEKSVETFQLTIIFTLIEIIITIIIFLLIYDNNRSKGSIDNASGVSILIELAKLFKKYPLENYDLVFLWSGAEEWGLKGSKNFCKRHYDYLSTNYDLDKSFNINIDMVGTYLGLETRNSTSFKNQKSDFNLNRMLEKTAIELNVPLIKYKKILEPKTDHLSFRSFAKKTRSSFQVACFHSDKDSIFIHSSKDTPDKCSSQILNGCLDICYTTIKTIDSMNF
ncbi:MAG: M28 family metallopeptidase [Promethearchaeota archaeon]